MEWISVNGGEFPPGSVYQGNCVLGDRLATDAEVAAWRAQLTAAQPPTTLQIVSTGTAALNGTYPITPADCQLLTSEVVFIATTGQQGAPKFTNGQATKAWPDADGALHVFTTEQFVPFAEAVAQYFDAVTEAGRTGSAWPEQPITIP